MGSRHHTANAIIALVLLGSVTLAVAQQAPSTKAPLSTTSPPESQKQSVTVVPAANDTEIARRLQGILESTGWFVSPRVSVREGVVSLDGTTATQEHRRWAGELAEKTQDVVAVVNRIEVEADVESTFGRAGEELRRFYRQVVQSWPIVALAIVVLVVSWIIAKLVSALARYLLSDRITSPLLLTVITRTLAISIFIFGIYFVLQIAGLTRLALTVLGGTGLLGIVIGFAFRDIAENFLASLLLSVRNPFRSGDLVEIAGLTGIVQNLNTRSTVLLALDGIHIQIPNATVYKSTIKNFSSNPNRRATFTVGIGYDSSAAKAQKLIADVLREHPAVLDAPEPLVLLEELGAATVNLRINYWFDSGTHSPARINSALLRQTKNALLQGGISLPDAEREVVFPQGVPVSIIEKATPSAAPVQPEGSQERRAPSADDASDATVGEGNLSSEAKEVREQSGRVPEAAENLLKNSPET